MSSMELHNIELYLSKWLESQEKKHISALKNYEDNYFINVFLCTCNGYENVL